MKVYTEQEFLTLQESALKNLNKFILETLSEFSDYTEVKKSNNVDSIKQVLLKRQELEFRIEDFIIQNYPKDKEDFSVYPPISTINTLIYFKLFNEYFSFRKKFQKALENFLQ